MGQVHISVILDLSHFGLPAPSGAVRSVVGGDGISRQRLEIPGGYQSASGRAYDGVFQFMKEASGAINHRLFVPQ